MFGQNLDGSGRIIMEQLSSVPEVDLLLLAIKTLDKKVWSRPPRPDWLRPEWRNDFYMRFDFAVPDWVESEEYCCIHGDPTLANMCFDGLNLRFIDPKTPGNGIPPLASVDLGKIMQSWLGWEHALFWQQRRLTHEPIEDMYVGLQVDPFVNFPEEDLRRAIFWCMVHFLRIVHREGQSGLGFWAAKNVRALQGLIGMSDETIGLGPRWDVNQHEAGELSGLQILGYNPAG